MSKHSSQMWENLRLNHYSKHVLALDRTQNFCTIWCFQGWTGWDKSAPAQPAARSRAVPGCHPEEINPRPVPVPAPAGALWGHFWVLQHPSSQSRALSTAALPGHQNHTRGLCGEGWGSFGVQGACATPGWNCVTSSLSLLALWPSASVWIFHVQLLFSLTRRGNSQEIISLFQLSELFWVTLAGQGRAGIALARVIQALLSRALSQLFSRKYFLALSSVIPWLVQTSRTCWYSGNPWIFMVQRIPSILF